MRNLMHLFEVRWHTLIYRLPAIQVTLWMIGWLLSFALDVMVYGILVAVAFVAYGGLTSVTWWLIPAVIFTLFGAFLFPRCCWLLLMVRAVMRADKRPLCEIAAELKANGMRCNCDLDNWEPERTTGHSWVCRIHKRAMVMKYRPYDLKGEQ